MPLKCGGLYFNQAMQSHVECPEINLGDEFTVLLWQHQISGIILGVLVGNKISGGASNGWTLATNYNHAVIAIEYGDGTSGGKAWSNTLWEPKPFMVGVRVSKPTGDFIVNGEIDKTFEFVTDFATNGQPVYIGAFTNLWSGWWMNGYIWNVMLYDVALSEDEIRWNYKHPDDPIEDGLVAWYPMTQGYGSKAVDYSGNGYHGTVVNARWVAEWQRGLYFYGNDNDKSYVLVNDSPELRCLDSNQFTIVALANIEYNEWPLDEKFIVRKGTDWDYGFGLSYDRALDRVFTRVCHDTLTRVGIGDDRQSGWHLYAAGFDGSNAWYGIDGEWTASAAFDYTLMDTTSEPLYIGGGVDGRYVRGSIGVVYMWNRYLDNDELWRLYLNPNDPPARENLVLWLPMRERKGVIVYDKSGYGNHGTIYNARWL